jgi:hypothetical protein
MKKTIQIVMLLLLCSVVLYISGSVGSGTFDYTRWSEGARFFVSSVFALAGVIAIVIIGNTIGLDKE